MILLSCFISKLGGPLQISHFRAVLGVCFKASLRAKLFLMKISFIYIKKNLNTFSYKWFRNNRFDTEAKAIRKWTIIVYPFQLRTIIVMTKEEKKSYCTSNLPTFSQDQHISWWSSCNNGWASEANRNWMNLKHQQW